VSSSKDKSAGATFQTATRYRRGSLPSATGKVIPTYKVYANPLEVAHLSVPQLSGGEGLWKTLATTRESIPEGGRLRQTEISQIMWATAGFTYGGQRTRATPIAMAGLEAYVIARELEDSFPGVYHYDPREHALEYLDQRDPSLDLQDVLLDDVEIEACAAVIALTGVPARVNDRAKARGYRYLYLEAGAAAQCAMLAAVALELVATVHGEFYDDELARLLQIDGTSEIPLCLVTLGT
jgi:SagB-type dehydrogenase family enzyme